MDGILADGRSGRLWMCKKNQGHALGIVLKIMVNDCFVDQLFLFRHAVLPQFASIEGKVMTTVEGTSHDIECDLCGAKRTWWMDRKLVGGLIGSLYDKTLLPKGG